MVKMSFSAAGDMLIQRRVPVGYEGFQDVKDFLCRGDARFFNLETTLHRGGYFGNQFYGGSYLHADPRVLEDAKAFGFNMLSFANNHTMDFSYGGMLATLRAVQDADFVNAGVGENLDEAAAPAYLDTPKGRVALISAVSTMMNPAAMAGRQSRRIPGRPGVNGLRVDEKLVVTKDVFQVFQDVVRTSAINAKDDISRAEGYSPALPEGVMALKDVRIVLGEETRYHTAPLQEDMERVERSIYEAETQADYILVSVHSHEVSGTAKENPGEFLVEFAHRCIDAGAHAVIGHGPHLLRPIEVYRDRPIFYSLGNFVLQNELIDSTAEDMYAKYRLTSDATLRELFYKRSNGYTRGLLSDRRMLEAALPYFEMEDGKLTRLELLPIELGVNEPRHRIGYPRPGKDPEIIRRLQELSAPYGTSVVACGDGLCRVEL